MAYTFQLYVLWLLLSSFVVGAPLESADESGGPPELTPDEFNSMKGTYFIKFYSPLCHHCRELAPKWDAAYKEVGGADTKGFKWGSVNCITFSDFCTENSINSYPTLRVYRDANRIYDYGNGGASKADLRTFAEQYIKRGDDALSPENEIASKEETELERANAAAAEKAAAHDKAEAEAAAQKPPVEEKEEAPAATPPSTGLKIPEGVTDVTMLSASDFGPESNVGRWFVLFIGNDCEDCESLFQKWIKHENFARGMDGINWGIVDCSADIDLCVRETLTALPSLRIYQDGVLALEYEGNRDSMTLRNFLVYASTTANLADFNPADLDTAASPSNPDAQLEGAKPNQEPNYMSGPTAQKPNYGNRKPSIEEVVQYTLDTLGNPIDEDPGVLIFGDSPESHHNFRTWGAPNAPPPPFLEPNAAASYANGRPLELNAADFDKLVKNGTEPWVIKFYSPKCPHCQQMAAAYDDLAILVKGKLNVASVNCELEQSLCKTEKVDAWPKIRLYRGSIAMDDYTGPRTAEDMMDYCQKAWEAQIYPIENQDELSVEIAVNIDKNITTFLYLYDQSVMPEDWVSLSKIANNIHKWGGRIYRSNNDQLRETVGINHRGTALLSVDYAGKVGEGTLKFHDFPWSNIPKKIRNVQEVSEWAYRAKWSLLQYLNPKTQTKFSPYVAIMLTDGKKAPSEDENIMNHHTRALDLLDFYSKRQIEDQDKLRIDRLIQHDKALADGKYKLARQMMMQPIEVPVLVDLAFAYIPLKSWVAEYGKFIDVSKHKVGNVIVVDFYNGVYLDEFNLVPINDDRDVLDDVVELLRRYHIRHPKTTFKSIRHFKHSMSGIPEPAHRPLHFESLPYQKSSAFASVPLLIKLLLAGTIIYLVYVKVVRPRLRAFARRNRAKSLKNNF